MPDLPRVGDEFAGYRLRAVLGKGGGGVVYQAENPRLGNLIALKALSPDLAADDLFRTRFLEESRIAAAMSHPHVIPIHDTGSCDGLLYIAMRYVAGTDLGKMIRKRGRLQPDAAVLLLGQAARALDAAHRRGLVHRDVKPANLLVERGNDDSDPDHLYLADFGITTMASGRTGLTYARAFTGTPDYMAPEQIRGLPVLGLADQYSLGCVLYECLTGRVPFEKDLDEAIVHAHLEEYPARPTALRPDLPPAVDDLFARVLAKQPGDRYQNCREFMGAARDALFLVPAGAPAGRSPRALRPPSLPGRREVAHDREVAYDRAVAHNREVAHDQDAGRRDLTASSGWPGPPPMEDLADTGSGRPGHRRSRISVPLLAAAFVLAVGTGAVIGAWTGSAGLGSSRQPEAGSATAAARGTATPATATARGAAARGAAALTPPRLPSASVKNLRQALAAVNVTVWTTGYLPPKSCTFLSDAYATCRRPYPGITEAVFQNYSSPAALYRAYETAIRQVNNGHFLVNVQDCGASAPPSGGGELSWNHFGLHTRAYSIAQLETGTLNAASQAAGRVFCNYDSRTNTENIIWTQTDGTMLGEVTGAPHLAVWSWWLHVHHNIAFNGQPMGTMDTTGPDPFPSA